LIQRCCINYQFSLQSKNHDNTLCRAALRSRQAIRWWVKNWPKSRPGPPD